MLSKFRVKKKTKPLLIYKCNVLIELKDVEFSDNSISCEIALRFNTKNVEMVINLMKVAALLILVCNAKCHEVTIFQ